jgi:hypothetical protein
MVLVLRPPHLPFQAVYTRVARVVGQSAADHADYGQSRKAEPELVHIELLMTRRWLARNRPQPFAHPAGNASGRLSRAHSIVENTRFGSAGGSHRCRRSSGRSRISG